jgi:hypothetical protein
VKDVDGLLANYRFEDTCASLRAAYGAVPEGWAELGETGVRAESHRGVSGLPGPAGGGRDGGPAAAGKGGEEGKGHGEGMAEEGAQPLGQATGPLGCCVAALLRARVLCGNGAALTAAATAAASAASAAASTAGGGGAAPARLALASAEVSFIGRRLLAPHWLQHLRCVDFRGCTLSDAGQGAAGLLLTRLAMRRRAVLLAGGREPRASDPATCVCTDAWVVGREVAGAGGSGARGASGALEQGAAGAAAAAGGGGVAAGAGAGMAGDKGLFTVDLSGRSMRDGAIALVAAAAALQPGLRVLLLGDNNAGEHGDAAAAAGAASSSPDGRGARGSGSGRGSASGGAGAGAGVVAGARAGPQAALPLPTGLQLLCVTLRVHPSLSLLDVSANGLGADGARLLGAVLRQPGGSLRTLRCGWNGFGDAGLKVPPVVPPCCCSGAARLHAWRRCCGGAACCPPSVALTPEGQHAASARCPSACYALH